MTTFPIKVQEQQQRKVGTMFIGRSDSNSGEFFLG